MLKAGKVVGGRFELLRKLGAGSGGSVWLARDGASELGTQVAVKLLHLGFSASPEATKRFAQEASLLATLDHPNIAKAIAYGTDDEHRYLALEYVAGEPLSREIGAHTRANRPFDRQELLRILTELCSAVAYAHSINVIHRDLKPQNVMVLHRAGQLFVKVLDFGLAKLIAVDHGEGGTTHGRAMGTPLYMSPEQARGEPADARSDVFSLGAIAFELITLHRAFARDAQERPLKAFDGPISDDAANRPSKVLARLSKGPRPSARSLRPGLPDAVDEVLSRAMCIDPSERYARVEDFLRDMERALRDLDMTIVAPQERAESEEELSTVRTRGATAAADGVEVGTAVLDSTRINEPTVTLANRVAVVETTRSSPGRRLLVATLVGMVAAALGLAAALKGTQDVAADPEVVHRIEASGRQAPQAIGATANTGPEAAPARDTEAAAAETAPATETATRASRSTGSLAATSEPQKVTPSSTRKGPASRTTPPERASTGSPGASGAPAATADLRRLLAEARADPKALDRLSQLADRIAERASVLADPSARRKIQRVASSNAMAGDIAGLELAIDELDAALAAQSR